MEPLSNRMIVYDFSFNAIQRFSRLYDSWYSLSRGQALIRFNLYPEINMLRCLLLLIIVPMAGFINSSVVLAQESLTPLVGADVVFAEKDGMLAVEAEHFFKPTLTEKRAFYLTTRDKTPKFEMDGDPNHIAGASGGAYLEILPDNRGNHGEKLIPGTNFSNSPGKLAVLHYKVNITTPGRYYVWVRAYSSGSEDKGLHVGIDGEWSDNGQRMQWCEGKKSWWWESKQRTENEHCGVPHQIFLDIEKAGEHTIHFSMREDGFEFDKWLMTTDREMARPTDSGPDSSVVEGKLPASFPVVMAPPTGAEPSVHGTPTPAVKSPNFKPKPQEKDYKEATPVDRTTSPTKSVSDKPLIEPRQENGKGTIAISGELRTWHDVTFTIDGPYAHEKDNSRSGLG